MKSQFANQATRKIESAKAPPRSILVALCVLSAVPTVFAQLGGGGWLPEPLTFQVQWPYTTNRSARYTFTNDVYHLWVYQNDAPFKLHTRTRPRTEQRFKPDYRQGEIQYQSLLRVPTNTSGVCIFQIHTGNRQARRHGATAFMLFWYGRDGGSVHHYHGQELANHLAGRWFQLNCLHNLATRTITVWINHRQVWQGRDNGAGDFYFKDGVYAQHGASPLMEVFVKDIHIWTRATSGPRSTPSNRPARDSNRQSGAETNRPHDGS